MTSSRKTKTAMIIAIIVLFAVAVSTMGVSYAVWISPDGSIGGGESTASPSVTPTTNNVWAKYFNYNVISDSEKELKGWSEDENIVEITTFYTADDGVNLSNVYILNVIWVENGTKKVLASVDGVAPGSYTTYTVYRIANSIFADATLKSLPVTIHVSESIREIDDAAFANLPNLETVYFENTNICTIGAFAFVGCSNLKTIVNVKGGAVSASDTSFLGTQITLNADGTVKFTA